MTSNELKKMLAAKPFRRFSVTLADGQSIEVNHPELAFVSPGGRTAFFFDDDPDAATVVDILMITSLHMGNGKRNNGKHKSNGH
jgi:hypothetical protein